MKFSVWKFSILFFSLRKGKYHFEPQQGDIIITPRILLVVQNKNTSPPSKRNFYHNIYM